MDLVGADGRIDLRRWAAWWRGYTAAPTAPGYQAVLVGGLERLLVFCDWIAVQSKLVGTDTSRRIAELTRPTLEELLERARSTTDGSALYASVTIPLLFGGPEYSPIYRIPQAVAALVRASEISVRPWSEIYAETWRDFAEDAGQAATAAAATVGQAAAAVVSPTVGVLAPVAIAAAVVLAAALLWKQRGRR